MGIAIFIYVKTSLQNDHNEAAVADPEFGQESY